MTCEFPGIDQSVIDEVKAETESLHAAMISAEAELATLRAEHAKFGEVRAALIERAARGDDIRGEQIQLSADVSATAYRLGMLEDSVKRQEELWQQMHLKMRKANGLAHKPRVLAAIQENIAAIDEWSKAQRAVSRAEDRMRAAMAVQKQAMSAGFQIDSATVRHLASGHRVAGFHEPAKCRRDLEYVWGQALVREALGEREAA